MHKITLVSNYNSDRQQRYMHNRTNKGADRSSRYMHKTINIYLHQSICNSTTIGLHRYCYLLLHSWPVPGTYLHRREGRRLHGRRWRMAARMTTDGGRADEGRRTAARTTTDGGRPDDDGRRSCVRRWTEAAWTTTEDGCADDGGNRTGQR